MTHPNRTDQGQSYSIRTEPVIIVDKLIQRSQNKNIQSSPKALLIAHMIDRINQEHQKCPDKESC